MGVLALQVVELAEVPGGGASERRHILDQHHASPEHIEIQRVPLQRGGPQVVERLGDVRHRRTSASTLEADRTSARHTAPSDSDCASDQATDQWDHWRTAFMGVKWRETDPQLTYDTQLKLK